MISLENSIKTCKVDDAWAARVQSDRFLNPCNMVCPVWNGLDSAGRPACVDSYVTKSEGCNNANDRVVVENHLRPNYIEYVNLSSLGYEGNLYADECVTPGYGNFGLDMYAVNENICCHNPYEVIGACDCCKPYTCASRISANTGYATASTPVVSQTYMKGIVVPNSQAMPTQMVNVEGFSMPSGQYQAAQQAQNARQMQYMQNQFVSSNTRSCSGF